MYEHFVCMCVSAPRVCPVFTGGQKIALDLSRLQLQMAVSYHVGIGSQTQVPYKSSKCS